MAQYFNGISLSVEVTKLDKQARHEHWQLLSDSIRLNQVEQYDCTTTLVWSYRKSEDRRDGISIKFGNMLKGFPYYLNGVQFRNSECAYIAGAYAGNNAACIHIQQLLAAERNGHAAKMIYRKKPEHIQHIRPDFESYNVEWMKYVVWQKCQHPDFAWLLKQVPLAAHTVENTSLHKGDKAVFWGARNATLMKRRKEVEAEVAQRPFRFNKDRAVAQTAASNRVNEVGVFEGKNVMGKIIKLCSLALIFGEQLQIDYQLLNQSKLFLLGKPLTF